MSKELTLDERVERIINQEIWCCDSSLLSQLLWHNEQHLPNDISSEFSWENIENQYYTDDEIWDLFSCNEQQDRGEFLETIRDSGEDIKEIFEWWRISDWLAEELDEINEPLLRNDYGNWWGRTGTGQHISLDGTIQQIVKNIDKNIKELYG